MEASTIYLPPRLELKIDLTDEQFWQLCCKNDDLQFEKKSTGELIIMAPTGGITGERNSQLTYQLKAWKISLRRVRNCDSRNAPILINN